MSEARLEGATGARVNGAASSMRTRWQEGPQRLDTPCGVDLWLCPLDRSGWGRDRANVWQVLDQEERARAGAFHHEVDAWRFAVARASLREVLSRYVGCDPSTLVFSYGRYGKPSLSAAGDHTRLVSFNLSHAGAMCLIAVARPGREVGVDVELVRGGIELFAIAERFFSLRERAAFSGVFPSALPSAFFACWARKESFVKCTGLGLTARLDAFDVSVDPDSTRARLIADRTGLSDSTWTLADVPVGLPYAAAVTVAGPCAPVRHFRLRAKTVLVAQ
jgi:4'-phosphopantetheinyl transferase